MRLLSEEDVVRTVDKHTLDDDRLDDDITCILEEVQTVDIGLVKWLSKKIASAQRDWDLYSIEEAVRERDAYMSVLNYLKMKGVIE